MYYPLLSLSLSSFQTRFHFITLILTFSILTLSHTHANFYNIYIYIIFNNWDEKIWTLDVFKENNKE